jgi:DNA-binding PadR family transcriptional regulator
MAPRPEVEPQNLTPSCNEALILASLREGPKHGYQLALDIEERSAGAFRFQHGTLYPILHKLEKRGLIKGSWTRGQAGAAESGAGGRSRVDDAGSGAAAGGGRKRKSYTLTAAGRRYADQQLAAWREFFASFLGTIDPPVGPGEVGGAR